MTEWKPIEAAPKQDIDILSPVLLSNGSYVDLGFWNDEYVEPGWYSSRDHDGYVNARLADPTHWMPLPSPPAEKAEKQ